MVYHQPLIHWICFASELKLDSIVAHKCHFLPMRTTVTGDQHCYYAFELSIRMPYKGTLGVLRELGLQNCDKWLCNSKIYSTSCETDKRTPSTGWYHWHISLHQNASIIFVLFCIIAASAPCKNCVPTNESRCLSRNSLNSSRRRQILSSWFWSSSTKHLIKFLSGPYLFRSTCIYS